MNHPKFVLVTGTPSPTKSRLAAVAALGAFALAGALFAATGTGSDKSSIDLKRDATPVAVANSKPPASPTSSNASPPAS